MMNLKKKEKISNLIIHRKEKVRASILKSMMKIVQLIKMKLKNSMLKM